jgi:FkbM family methyltransferase
MLRYLRQIAKHSPLGFVVRRLRRPPATAPLDPITQQHADYDQDTVAIIRRVLKPDSSAVDVGAHAGSILGEIVAAAPRGRHHAFEPLPHLAGPLRAAFPGVTVYQKALGDTPGTATFQHVLNDPGYSGLRHRQYDRPDPVFEELTVEVVRLDDVIGADEQIAFIKLDIEGGEYHAIRGALGTIRRCRPVIVFEAARCSTGCYGVSAGALFDLIADEMGYSVYTLRAWLTGGAAYTRESFAENWQIVREYYFVAGPAT